MSGYTTDIVGKHGVLSPGTHYLQKPFEMAKLHERIAAVLAKPA